MKDDQKNNKVKPSLEDIDKDKSAQGRLKIFIGAAPGVGKTYSMLKEAYNLLANNVDVAVGFIETHQREEPNDFLESLEVIPQKSLKYQGKTYKEIDVNAIIKRAPSVVIIDDLAHSNITGSRHKKRYLDIIEILEAGIDVYTAVNIQHIASIHEDIEAITELKVSELIPDYVIEMADEVMVIDLTPDDLIKRFKKGKVHVEQMTEESIERYFSINTLTALRELSFRFATFHIAKDVKHYKKTKNIDVPWTVAPSILVCLSEKEVSHRLLKHGVKVAKDQIAKKIAVYIVRPDKIRSEKSRQAIKYYRQLAETMGYEVYRINAQNIAESIVEFAKEHNVSDIIVGKIYRPLFIEWISGSLVYDLLRLSKGINIQVIASALPKRFKKKEDREKIKLSEDNREFIEYVKAFLAISFASSVALFSDPYFNETTQAMMLLLAVLWCAARYSFRVSIFANVISFISYIYFFTNPRFTLSINSIFQVIAFVAFIVVSATVGQLTARLKFSLAQLKARESELSKLYDFSASLAKVHRTDTFYSSVIELLNYYFKLPFVIISADREGSKLQNTYPEQLDFGAKEMAAAKWAWEHKKACGAKTDTFSTLPWHFILMQASEVFVGIMAVNVKSNKEFLESDQQYLFKTMLTQISYRLLKNQIEAREKNQQMLKEQQYLEKLLLSSVSHDFKTPLASIVGVISSLKAYDTIFSTDERLELLEVAHLEAQRLNQYIDKVLQLVKVEYSKLKPDFEPVSLNDLIQDVIKQFKIYYPKREVVFKDQVEVLVELDHLLFRQVMVNLVENAMKYTPDDKNVSISIFKESNQVIMHVVDQGPGLPQSVLSRIFDLFYRFEKQDYNASGGHGLGLAICKAIVKSHNGAIKAMNRAENNGCCFEIVLPLVQPAEILETKE